MNSPQLAIVLGTRPEIIKLAPIVRECHRRDVPYAVVHTGQHYSRRLTEVFFDELELPSPDHQFGVGSDTHGHQTGAMIADIEDALVESDPETVFVHGDTNTTLAATIAASKLDVELGHVEAGLRSDDRGMPEEINRIICDHAADRLFAPTANAAMNLAAEGIPETRVAVTGNTVVDAIDHNRTLAADRSTVLSEFGVAPGEYGVVTLHRAENVDDTDRFAELLSGVDRAAREFDLEMVYPIHPRARAMITDLSVPETVQLVDPLDYLDFLRLQSEAALVLTDSGGVQEEACVLDVPCVTLRENTERPETVAVGANRLAGATAQGVVDAARTILRADPAWENPFGDGDAAGRILDAAGVAPAREVVQ